MLCMLCTPWAVSAVSQQDGCENCARCSCDTRASDARIPVEFQSARAGMRVRVRTHPVRLAVTAGPIHARFLRRRSLSEAAVQAAEATTTTSGHRREEGGVRSAAHLRWDPATIRLRCARSFRAFSRLSFILARCSSVSSVVAGAGAGLQSTPRLHRDIAERRRVCGRRRT